jgi:transcriptional regulator with XRE-family HTH domain
MTQEQAADLLAVAPRTLSDYENGRAKVPDDIVAAMAEVYKSPMLAWWHLKQTSILGKYLPEIIMPRTDGDMAFQLAAAKRKLEFVVDDIMRILDDGKIHDDEKADFSQAIEMVRVINAKLLSVIIYAGEDR